MTYKIKPFYFIILLVFSCEVLADNDCPKIADAVWTNCHGTFVFEDGDKYVGQWLSDKFHGEGIYYFADGDQMSGTWVNGEIESSGTYIFADGGKYVGEFQNGLSHGEGTHYYKNGDKYVGEWIRDKRHGNGIMYLASGGILSGIWEDDELVTKQPENIVTQGSATIDSDSILGQLLAPLESAMVPLANEMQNSLDPIINQVDGEMSGMYYSQLPNCPSSLTVVWTNCRGKYVFDDGDQYEGEWLNDKFEGRGVYYFLDGSVVEGIWKNGELIQEQSLSNLFYGNESQSQNEGNSNIAHNDFGLSDINLDRQPNETEIDYNLRLSLVSFLRAQYFMSKALGVDERVALIQNTIEGLQRGDLGADSDINKVVELSSSVQDEIDAKIQERAQLSAAQRVEFTKAIPNYFHGLYCLYQLVQSSASFAQEAGDLVKGNLLNAFGVLSQAVTVFQTLPTLLHRFQGSSGAIIEYASSNGIDTDRVEKAAAGLF